MVAHHNIAIQLVWLTLMSTLTRAWEIQPVIDWQQFGKQMNLPGHIGYDPSSQTCCKGKVFDVHSLKCCGDTTYDSRTHRCCNGEVVELIPGHFCCGKTMFDPRKENSRCCAGKVYDLTKDQEGKVACCGQDLYRPRSEICCGDSSKGRGVVLPRAEDRNISCCDTTAYDTDTQVCCLEFNDGGPGAWKSNLIPLEGNKRDCCGGKSFDVSTHMCCVRVVVDRKLRCCGALGYDPKTEACCVHPPQEGSKYPGVSKIPKPDDDTDCCNGKPYKSSTQSCCNYNIESSQECKADEINSNPTTTTPKSQYDANSESELCCGGITVPKNNKNDVCCYDAQTDELLFPWMQPGIWW